MHRLKNFFAFSAKSVLLASVAVGALSVVAVDIADAQSGGNRGGSDSSGGGGGGGNADRGNTGDSSSDRGRNASGGQGDGGEKSDGSSDRGQNASGSQREGSGGASGGQGNSGNQGVTGNQGSAAQSGTGGSVGQPVATAAEDDDDGDESDRPVWAGGNPELNPHAGAGTGNPTSGTTKGDIYGDLVVLLRDLATGEPIVAGISVDPETGEEITEYFICLDPACESTVSTEFGEIPEDVTAIEVEFGRSSVARAPDRVTDQALDEALSKLEVAQEVSVDLAGRIAYSIDGTWYTIDSPLENLALYIDLSVGLAAGFTSEAEAALGSVGLATLDTAASLLAGVADKTGDITLDYLVNENVIGGVVDPGDYYDYSTFVYSRTYPTEYSYWVSIDGALPELATLDINAYLADASINGALPEADDFAALFAAASDDALEIIELVHTQVHTEVLPGTIQ